jgi:23S rRNA (uracil-5-)-methyltransferase RumA
MKFGDTFEGRVERVGKDGAGRIWRSEGKPIAIYNTIPGETVKATVTRRTKEAMRANLDEIVERSPDRVEPRCPYAGTCGGCKWQHISYDRQAALKLDLVRDAFAVHGVPCPIETIERCPEPFYYRNRMDFVFGREGSLGLKLPDKWWEVLNLETCFLLSPESVEIVNRVRDWARSTGLPFWDSKKHEGFFRYLVIREGKNAGERMVMLVTSPSNQLPVPSYLDAAGPNATSVVHGINARLTDLSIADEIRPLKGHAWIHEEINGIKYKITPNAFFQTNSIMAAKLQDKVREFVGSGGTLLDLYCGSGFFSLALTSSFKRTLGIELNAEAIACAKENATANEVSAEYFVSAAEKFDWARENPDVVIVDPPRAGMHPDVIATFLKQRPPVIVYVSCSVERFVKEWVGVDGHVGLNIGYRISAAAALDLFPQTPHVECVFRLERI